MPDRPRLEELNHLYEKLSAEERDELLHCLLIAASISGETVIRRLGECLLEPAGRELTGNPCGSAQTRGQPCTQVAASHAYRCGGVRPLTIGGIG